eukprot:7591823-Alexandrium_andersonii.AAC.1
MRQAPVLWASSGISSLLWMPGGSALLVVLWRALLVHASGWARWHAQGPGSLLRASGSGFARQWLPEPWQGGLQRDCGRMQ